jgi:hypothetical protein
VLREMSMAYEHLLDDYVHLFPIRNSVHGTVIMVLHLGFGSPFQPKMGQLGKS